MPHPCAVSFRAAASGPEYSVSPRNVTGLVDALEANGYVERRPHPTDRRAILVTLTERGQRTTAGMVRERQATAVHLVEGFDNDRLESLDGDLATIAARLHQLVEAARSRESA